MLQSAVADKAGLSHIDWTCCILRLVAWL